MLFTTSAEAGAIINRPLAIGLNQGLVGHWTFDGKDLKVATGSAFDISGNGNHGSLINGPKVAQGRIGQALEFDGKNDRVNAGSASILDDLGPMTASAWIYPRGRGESNEGAVFSKQTVSEDVSGWALQFSSSITNAIAFRVDYGGTDINLSSSANTIALNQWQHLAVIWDGSPNASNAHIYINGTETAYATIQNATLSRISDATFNLNIGNHNAETTTFDGLIDDVRIYNCALSTIKISHSIILLCEFQLRRP